MGSLVEYNICTGKVRLNLIGPGMSAICIMPRCQYAHRVRKPLTPCDTDRLGLI